jgi:CRISPR-associated protein Cas5h
MVIEWLVRADYAHFSHPATIYSSLTYPVPPKTTVMGMLSAIAGEERYDHLSAMRYSVAIEHIAAKRQFCFNGIKSVLSELNPKKTVGFRKGRKQFYRELLVDVSYRVFCDLQEVRAESVEKILDAMHRHKSYYPLYMGINLCLADYTLCGVYQKVENTLKDEAYVDGLVPLHSDFVIENGKRYADVHMPTKVDEARNFGGFEDYLVELEGRPILCRNVEIAQVGEYRIVWS